MVSTNLIDSSTANITVNTQSFAEMMTESLVRRGMMLLSAAIIMLILLIIAYWRILVKAGEKGWKSLIPIYNTMVLFKIAGISSWMVLVYFASIFIPVIGSLITWGITIYFDICLAKAFGKGNEFIVGLILLTPIFMLILAFGDSEYQLDE